MKPFRDYPIQQKLLVTTLLICGTVLFVAIAVLFTFQVLNFRSNFQHDIATLAAIIANNSKAALTSKDAKAAGEVVQSIKANPTVLSASLVLPDGAVFAHFGITENSSTLSHFPPPSEYRFTGGHLLFTQPIVLNRETIGTLYLRSEFQRTFMELLGFYGLVIWGVMIVSVSLALFLSRRLRRFITEPVLQLAETVRAVGEKKNYSVRATVSNRGDELGRLTEGFNQMLGQIQTQDSALQTAQKQLARQVEELKERTRLASFDAVVGLALTRNDSLEEILQQCTQAVVDYLGAAFARIWTLNTAERVLELQASAGLYTHRNGAHQRVPVGQTKLGQIVSSREPLLTNTVVGDRRVYDQEWATREKMVSFAGIPLMVGDEVVGVMALFGRQPITSTAFQTLGSVASAIALGIERKRTEAVLRDNEERFRSLFENVRIGLYRCTAEGRVIMGNPTFFRMLGCDAPELMYAKVRGGLSANLLKTLDGGTSKAPAAINLDEVISEGSANRRLFKNLLEAEGEVVGVESCWKRVDGSVIHVRESARAIRNAQGALVFSEGTVEDITERKKAEAELEKLHKELLEASRYAGMAEVATGVLHNVGNVLNSVSVSATLVSDRLRQSKVTNLCRATSMLREQNGRLVEFLTSDPKGKLLPEYLGTVADQLAGEQTELLGEMNSVGQHIEHIKEIVAMQQSYAKVSGAHENLSAEELVEDALRMNSAALERHRIQVVREFGENTPAVCVDRHKVLQILVNLLRNAKYAMDRQNADDKRLIIQVASASADRVKIAIRDNGIGIAPENLVKIFSHGFTTKKDGHGFGLHSGANAAKEMRGSLTAYSGGLGQGATFTLELPVAASTPNQEITANQVAQ